MNRLLLALVIAIAAGQANADPASAESVQRLLKLTKSETTLNSMYAAVERVMQQSMQQATAGRSITPEQQRILDAVPAKVFSVVRSELTWDKLEPQYIQLYSETFDQDEINGLIAFYQSPAGQAYINKIPTVLQKSLAIAQAEMQVVAPKIAEAVNQAVVEAKLAK